MNYDRKRFTDVNSFINHVLNDSTIHVSNSKIHEFTLNKSYTDFDHSYSIPWTFNDKIENIPEFQEIFTFNKIYIQEQSVTIHRLISIVNLCVFLRDNFQNEWSNILQFVDNELLKSFLNKFRNTFKNNFFPDCEKYYQCVLNNRDMILEDMYRCIKSDLINILSSHIRDTNVITNICLSYLF